MKMMFGLLSDHVSDFISFYEEKAKKGEVLILDVKNVFSRFTADGISTAVLGFEADCVRNEDSQIFTIAKNIIQEFFGAFGAFKTIFAFALPTLYQLSGLQLIGKDTIDFLYKVVINTMNERERKNLSRPDVIQLMLELRKGQLQSDNANEVNDKELENFSANIEYDVGSKTSSSAHFTNEDWIGQGLIFFGAG